ncbi:MAG: hypothetical protein EXR72_16460 [Myxococcales bacterium]|nr:hypothetical protein [Myxococcales bacterium]
MPPRGKESILRRQKEIARQQKQKEKLAKREEKKTQGPRPPGYNKGDVSPDELGSLEDLIGPTIVPEPSEGGT